MTDGLMPPPTGDPISTVPPPTDQRHRPWWGLGDVALGLPVIIGFAFVGALIGLPFVSGDDLQAMLDGTGDLPLAILATSLLGQQMGQGIWPLIVARWKGFGPVRDWHLQFQPIDLVLGFGTAIMAVGFAGVAGVIASSLVGLDDTAQADNTQFLRDAEGSGWLYLLLLSTVIGAPLAEEIFFRGLVLRAFEKRAGQVAAVIGSTVLFVLPHYIGTSLAGTVVLYASIGAVGAVLAVVTVMVGRLWPAIIAHILFNALGVADALGWLDVTDDPTTSLWWFAPLVG